MTLLAYEKNTKDDATFALEDVLQYNFFSMQKTFNQRLQKASFSIISQKVMSFQAPQEKKSPVTLQHVKVDPFAEKLFQVLTFHDLSS